MKLFSELHVPCMDLFLRLLCGAKSVGVALFSGPITGVVEA